jgi:hypothetical protein
MISTYTAKDFSMEKNGPKFTCFEKINLGSPISYDKFQ